MKISWLHDVAIFTELKYLPIINSRPRTEPSQPNRDKKRQVRIIIDKDTVFIPYFLVFFLFLLKNMTNWMMLEEVIIYHYDGYSHVLDFLLVMNFEDFRLFFYSFSAWTAFPDLDVFQFYFWYSYQWNINKDWNNRPQKLSK